MCTERQALLAELESGHVEYTVCILPQDLADNTSTPVDRRQGDCTTLRTDLGVTGAERVPFIVVLSLMCVSLAAIFLSKLIVPVVRMKKTNVEKLELDRHI